MSVSQRDDGEMDDDLSPPEDAVDGRSEPAPIPDHKWECEHCTYVNKAGTRVCAVCCKTSTKNVPPTSRNGEDRRNANGRIPKEEFSSSAKRRSSRQEGGRERFEDSRQMEEKNFKHDGDPRRRSSNKNDRGTDEEIFSAFGKQLRVSRNDSPPIDKKKGRIRKISFWPKTNYFT